ncbi:hypothetical protein LTR28_002119, partial [Elasticomyces elasticus]
MEVDEEEVVGARNMANRGLRRGRGGLARDGRAGRPQQMRRGLGQEKTRGSGGGRANERSGRGGRVVK